MNESNKKIILTAGGTGGHLYGALSLTEELKINGYEVFLFTDKRVETLLRDFDLSRISLGAPIFDIEKLKWLNGVWLRSYDDEEYREKLISWLELLFF